MKTKQLAQELKADIAKVLNIKEDSIFIKVYENSSSVFYTLEEFFSQYNPEEIGKGQCNLMFRIDADGKSIITFQLKDMYNCSGIIVATDLFIAPGIRHMGLGKLITSFVADFSRYYGYGILQASDKVSSEYQCKIFEKLGWEKTTSFFNPKTKNELVIWLLKLN